MVSAGAQLTANDVLQIIHQDEPFLFLGAAFITVGLVTIAFCALRRRWDGLLVWLAIFASLYGLRLWLESGLLNITLAGNEFFDRIRWAVNFMVPIPAFLFFQASGLLRNRGKIFTAALCLIFLSLGIATLAIGRLQVFHTLNDTVVIVALLWVLIQTLRRSHGDRDLRVLRAGLICFVVLAVWDNTLGPYWRFSSIEPYGFAVMLGSFGYVAARRTLERDRELGEIQQELELARRIQLSILPGAFPELAAFRIAARYVPMSSVAGDLYDFPVADAGQVGLFIADVSGHGVPAALIASMVKMAATSQREHVTHPAQLLAGMNAALCGNTQGQFVTAAYAYMDVQARELRYAAAGHPAMLLLRNGAVTEIAENGLLMAATESATYTEKTVPIEPGDRLLLYTDGLIEARNNAGAMFGQDALSAALNDTAKLPPTDAADQIIARVQQWAKSQDDDLTVVVCDFTGAS